MGFYQYTANDFEKILASELHAGDRVGLADWGSDAYGAITLDDVTKHSSGDCYLNFRLPPEAKLKSQNRLKVTADWEDGQRVIYVEQFCESGKIVLAMRG